eukprot:c8173_g1_i1 orf=388-1410(+)
MNDMEFSGFLRFLLFTIVILVMGTVRGAYARPFFVFGSSYVDTGNVKNSDSTRPYPWKLPYGESWPGTPSGRYSNGHVLTDVIAESLNLSLPISFEQRVPGKKYVEGINFGTGGSGVLTAYGYPPISEQIDSLQGIISSYKKDEISSAIVIYATAGDDYLYYLTMQNSPLSGIYPLTTNVGKQISSDLVRLYGIGLRNFAVTYLPPMGCLPVATAENSFRACNESWNTDISQAHNARVLKNVMGLRHYFTNGTIVLLDLYSAFPSALATLGTQQPLRPCCVGATVKSKCSDVDATGHPNYSLCSNPTSKFYWDDLVHPTEAGWRAVVKLLQPALSQLKQH